jgi:hypothetical protein
MPTDSEIISLAFISLRKKIGLKFWELALLCNVCTGMDETPWPESTSAVHRPSDRRLSAKLVPTFADRGCQLVSVTFPYGRILRFLEQSRYSFLQVAPQLYSRGWVNPVLDLVLPRKPSSAENAFCWMLNNFYHWYSVIKFSSCWKIHNVNIARLPAVCFSHTVHR